MISTASQDGTIGLWTSDGKLIRKILLNHKDRDQGNEPAPSWRVRFSPDSQLLAAIKTDDKTVQILDLTGNIISQLSGHEQPVESIDFSLDGQLISTGSRDSTARLWTLSGDLVAVLAGHSDIVWSVKFSTDGQHIATASEDNTVKV